MEAVRRLVSFYWSGQFARFILVGGAALAVHWAARIVINRWLDFNASIVIAYAIGICTAYVLNRWLVFPKSGRRLQTEVMYFALVNVIAFPVVWGLSWLLGEVVLPPVMRTDLARAAGHGIAITCPVFFNYAAHKLITFHSRQYGRSDA